MTDYIFFTADMKIILFALVLHLGTAYAVTSPVGEAFYVPKEDVLGEHLFGGSTVLANLPDDCFTCDNASITTNYFDYFENTKMFYQQTAQTYSLGGELERDFTLGGTLDATTGKISSTNRTIKGSTLNVVAKNGVCKIRPQCLHDKSIDILSPDFQADFEALPRVIRKQVVPHLPLYKYDFSAYEHFLNQWGSHIVTGVTYGARLYQHCFSKVEEDYSYRNYSVRACVAFNGGTDTTKVNISGCAGISKQEASTSMSMETTTRLILRGGTAETRAKLAVERTNDLIAKFLTELDSAEPIEYSFTALWTLLREKYIDTEHFAKVRHLEGYYLGVKNFDCPEVKENEVSLQGFTEASDSTEDVPSYRCVIPYQGCHEDSDCQYHPIWCECSGDSCFVSRTRTLDTEEQREYVEPVHNANWGWQGCHYVRPGVCVCQNGNKYNVKAIWEQDSDGGEMMRSFHSKAMSCKREAALTEDQKAGKKEEL